MIPTPASSCAARWGSRPWWSRPSRPGPRISWSSRSSHPGCSKRSSASSAEPMDLSRYAALFATESREQLSACGAALLEWERHPAAPEPVVSLFRAMHTFKGMAAAMGYTNLTELAHRTESMLDVLRSDPAGGREQFDLFFRIVDALEHGAAVAVEQGDAGLNFTALLAELDEAS